MRGMRPRPKGVDESAGEGVAVFGWAERGRSLDEPRRSKHCTERSEGSAQRVAGVERTGAFWSFFTRDDAVESPDRLAGYDSLRPSFALLSPVLTSSRSPSLSPLSVPPRYHTLPNRFTRSDQSLAHPSHSIGSTRGRASARHPRMTVFRHIYSRQP